MLVTGIKYVSDVKGAASIGASPFWSPLPNESLASMAFCVAFTPPSKPVANMGAPVPLLKP